MAGDTEGLQPGSGRRTFLYIPPATCARQPHSVNGKMPLYLTLAGAMLLVAALVFLQPYSVTSPWSVYTRPAQRFLQAALRQDSVALAGLSASSDPVVWALRAARVHRESLAVWARGAEAWTGAKWGDTAEVLLQTPTDVCSKDPIWIRFAGTGINAIVLRASSTCFEDN